MVPTGAGKVNGVVNGTNKTLTNGSANGHAIGSNGHAIGANGHAIGSNGHAIGSNGTLENGGLSQKHIGSLAGYAEPKELKIPVPYGHIAAKEWGPVTGQPVLGLHGWQDNAATFDLLVEHLPPTLHLIVLDLPGHGLSSHLPAGGVYGCLQFLIDLRRVVNYLGWKQFSILAHSLGAIISFMYSAVHLDQVLKFVSIDILFPGSRQKNGTVIRKFLDSFLMEEAKEITNDDTFSHSEDSALDLMWKRRTGLTKEGAVPLLKRGCRKCDDGVTFTRDHRLKPFLTQPWEIDSKDNVFQLIKSIKAEILVIVATESKLASTPEDVQQQTKDILSEGCKSFRCVEVKGSHFVHLNDPAAVAIPIREFLCAEISPTLLNSVH